jgi:uncharacterized membrane protein
VWSRNPGALSATLSPVRLMSPSSLRFGVWRPLLGLIQGNGAAPAESGWLAEWQLHRRYAMSLRQMFGAYLVVSGASVMAAAGLWWVGASQALPIASAELLVLCVGMLLYVRHASDRDAISMKPSLVRVEQQRAGHVRRVDFNPRWVRIEPDLHDGSLVRLSGQGRSVVVGEFVARECRPQLAEEFRWALRHLDD